MMELSVDINLKYLDYTFYILNINKECRPRLGIEPKYRGLQPRT